MANWIVIIDKKHAGKKMFPIYKGRLLSRPVVDTSPDGGQGRLFSATYTELVVRAGYQGRITVCETKFSYEDDQEDNSEAEQSQPPVQEQNESVKLNARTIYVRGKEIGFQFNRYSNGSRRMERTVHLKNEQDEYGTCTILGRMVQVKRICGSPYHWKTVGVVQ